MISAITARAMQMDLGPTTLVEEQKIEEAIRRIPGDSFTVLDFMKAFRTLYPVEWKGLAGRFGLLGSKRRYTVSTYFSNRLDVYSRRAYSVLLPFTTYSKGRFRDYRKTTEVERKVFGSPWIAVFKKKSGIPTSQR